MAAYAFLAAYAYHGIQQQQVEAKTMRLSSLTQRQRELLRKQEVVAQVLRFDNAVTALKLDRRDWLFYDVNVQGDFSFAAAQQIIQQCSDSELAYYWPVSLEVKAVDKSARAAPASGRRTDVNGDVQLTVKGQFVARR